MQDQKPPEPASKPIDPKSIYPEATHSATQPAGQNYSLQNNPDAAAGLEMTGQPNRYSQPRSRSVDILGGLIILTSVISIAASQKPLNIAFNAVYIAIGLGLISRSAMARKIVIVVSILGLLGNIMSLFATSLFLSGKKSIVPVLSILFSICVQITVLSVLTWHQTEKEFH